MKNGNVSDEMRFPLTIIVVGLDNEIPKYKMLLAQIFFCFNWDSLHARLNSHYEARSYKKRSKKIKITGYRKSI